ncbi:MAG: N-acetylmuramoyl-L-alanine amidase, partial [Selenomonadales bacterium]|nr:N-acetylmuramoyl-L-alanine amidase [Selenomonadales bacterium]
MTMKICINGGHCPTRDSGAVGSRITEADYTARMMTAVSDYLTKAGCTVLTVQEKDLSDICRAANEWGADLFISIHCNAANRRARGTETFAHYGSKKGKHLAACIQSQLIGAIDTIDRGVKEAGFYVLK